jgi:hypothetical protein
MTTRQLLLACDIQQEIDELTSKLFEGMRKITKEEASSLRNRFRNLRVPTNNVFVGEDFIALKGESVNNNWRYYAGLEYINNEEDEEDGDGFIVLGDLYIYEDMEFGEGGRIKEILNIIRGEGEDK